MQNQLFLSFLFFFAITSLASAKAINNPHAHESHALDEVTWFETKAEAITMDSPTEKHAMAALELAASGSLEITHFSTFGDGNLLISGWFDGTLFWGTKELDANGETRGFLIITKVNDVQGEGQLIWCEPDWIPRRAWPTQTGFQILAEDALRDHPILFNLFNGTKKQDLPPPPEDGSQGVTQPEDLPEGTGG